MVLFSSTSRLITSLNIPVARLALKKKGNCAYHEVQKPYFLSSAFSSMALQAEDDLERCVQSTRITQKGESDISTFPINGTSQKNMLTLNMVEVAAKDSSLGANDNKRRVENTNGNVDSEDKSHCNTCTCPSEQSPQEAPKWSFHKRMLPDNLVGLSSPRGKQLFSGALKEGAAECYFPLSEQFLTQSDPAYCGVSTLVMVLNALSIDPNVRWRGGWRWFEDEMVTAGCCLDLEEVSRLGITMEQFASMGRCNGANVQMRRPGDSMFPARIRNGYPRNIAQIERNGTSRTDLGRSDATESRKWCIDSFRSEIKRMVCTNEGFFVVSFARSSLGQTGDGHFSPIAAYNEEADMVLILDVARFKYAPYWCSISELYEAMQPIDEATERKRGWFLVYPAIAPVTDNEAKRPGNLVPSVKDVCPVGAIKISFCSASPSSQKRLLSRTRTKE